MHDNCRVGTGVAAFIESRLTKTETKDNDVIVLDDVSTGKIKNKKELPDTKKNDFVKDNIKDLVLLQKTFKDQDQVFHTAVVTSVPEVFIS
jgi:UDP-glucose 4-epimerase